MSAIAALRWAIAGAIVVGLVWQFARQMPEDIGALRPLMWWPLAVALVLGTASYVALATAWARLRDAGETWIESGGIWFASLVARYAPGGIWQGAVRIADAHVTGASKRRSLALYAAEQALTCASAAALAVVLAGIPPMLDAGLVSALLLVAAAAAAAPALLRRIDASTRWPPAAIAWTVLGHALMAAGFAAVSSGWTPLAAADMALAARAFLIAGLAGVLAIFVPAGLGVREGVLAWLLSPQLGTAVALAIALGARIWLIACEAIAWGLWALMRFISARIR